MSGDSASVLEPVDVFTPADAPRVSAELFVIPLTAAPRATDARQASEESTDPVRPNRFVIYAPLRQAAFVANAGVVNFLADLQQGRYAAGDDPDGALIEFLRRLQIVDGGDESRPVQTFTGDPEPTAVTLFLTTACNLRCTYCYASAGDTPVRHMDMSVARRGIEFIAGNARRRGTGRIELNFHGGGEPTVNWRTMTSALDYAREVAARPGEPPLTVTASTATNAVLNDAQ